MLEFGVLNQDLVDELLTTDKLSFVDYLHDLTTTDLDLIIEKICEHIFKCLLDLQKKEHVILRILKVLWDIITNIEISDDHSLSLSNPLLYLVVEFSCSVTIAKKTVYLINRLFEKQQIIQHILKDESMKTTLKRLGGVVLKIGDYECQAAIVEVMLRISDFKNRKMWSKVWFPVESMQEFFLSIKPEEFELECRRFLNFINRSEFGQKVHSFVVHSVIFDSVQLKKPYGSDFWIDFNYSSRSISFYCSELDEDDNSTQGTWETVVIGSDVVDSCILNVDSLKRRKEFTIYLKCPSHQLLSQPNESSVNHFNGNLIKFSFWESLDVHPHIQFVYGNLYNGCEEFSSQNRSLITRRKKISCTISPTYAENINNDAEEKDLQNHEDSNYYQNVYCSQKRRKISNATLHSKNDVDVKCNEISFLDNSVGPNRNRKISAATVWGYNEIENDFLPISDSQSRNRKISEATIYNFENFNENYTIQKYTSTSQTRTRKASEAFVCNEENYEYNVTNDISNGLDQEIPKYKLNNRKTSEASTVPYLENCQDNYMSSMNNVSSLRSSQNGNRKASKAIVFNLKNQNESYSTCASIIGESQANKRKAIDIEKDDELNINNGAKDDYQSSSQFKKKCSNSDSIKTFNVINRKESNISDERNIHVQSVLSGKKIPIVILQDFKNNNKQLNSIENDTFLEMSSRNKNRKIVHEIDDFQTESERNTEEMNSNSTTNKISKRRSRTCNTLRGNLCELVEALDDKKDIPNEDYIQNKNKSFEREIEDGDNEIEDNDNKIEDGDNEIESLEPHFEKVSPLRHKNSSRKTKSNAQKTNIRHSKRKIIANNVNFGNEISKVEVTAEISQIKKKTGRKVTLKNRNSEQKSSADEISPTQIESKSAKKRIKINTICLNLDSADEISPSQIKKSIEGNYIPIENIIIKDISSNLSEDQRIMSNSSEDQIIKSNSAIQENKVVNDKNILTETASQEVNHDEPIVNTISKRENNNHNRSCSPALKLQKSSQELSNEIPSKEFIFQKDEKSSQGSIPDLDDLVNQISKKADDAKRSHDNISLEKSNLENQTSTMKYRAKQDMSKGSKNLLGNNKKTPTSSYLNQTAKKHQTYNKSQSKSNQLEQISDSADSGSKMKATTELETVETDAGLAHSSAKMKAFTEPQQSNELLSKSNQLERDCGSADSNTNNKATDKSQTDNKLVSKSNQREKYSDSAGSVTSNKATNEPQTYSKLLSCSNQLERDSNLKKVTSYGRAETYRLVRKSNQLEDFSSANSDIRKQSTNERAQTFDEGLTANQIEKHSALNDSPKRNKTQKKRKIRLYNPDRAPLCPIDMKIPNEKKQLSKDELFSVVIPPGDELDEWEPIKHSSPCTSKHQIHQTKQNSSSLQSNKISQAMHLDETIVDQKDENDFQSSKIGKMIRKSYNDSGIFVEKDNSGISKSRKRKSDKMEDKSAGKTQCAQKSRAAAKTATEKNKMLAKNNDSDFDCYDDIESEGSLYKPPQKQNNISLVYEPVKERKKRSKNLKKFKGNTTESTVSSDVSWFHKKTGRLFETPKKNYSLWKKEKAAKIMKPLPIQVSNKNNVKLEERSNILKTEVMKKKHERKQQSRISNKNKNAVEGNSKYSDSETRKKCAEWSDLDRYSLTKEKQANSYHMLNFNKVLQAFDEEVKRSVSGSYKPHAEKEAVELDSNYRHSTEICADVSAIESIQEEEFSEKNFENNNYIDQPELHNNFDSLHNISEVKAKGNSKSKNNLERSDGSTTVSNDVEDNEPINRILENENSNCKNYLMDEDNFNPEPLFDSGIENTELFKEISPDVYDIETDEANGRQLHLERYLTEATLPDKQMNKTYSSENIALFVEPESFNSKPLKRNRAEEEDFEENSIKKQRLSESIKSNEEGSEVNKIKHGLFSNTRCESKSSFIAEIHKDSEQDASEKLFLRSEMSNIRKICRSDILSKNPMLGKNTRANTEHSIFKVLGNELKKLTKQLVGTMQRYVNDLCEKLTSHRENMVEATELLCQQNIAIIDKQDLIMYQKECKNKRLCLEKCLRKLQELSNEYFEAEEQCNKKLQYIQKKATKKFTHHAQMAKYNAVKMMERKSLLEIKKFLSKFQLNVE